MRKYIVIVIGGVLGSLLYYAVSLCVSHMR